MSNDRRILPVKKLYDAQDGRCFHCGVSMSPFQNKDGSVPMGWSKEHFVPRSRLPGGKPLKYNIVLAHLACNRRRGCRYPTRREVRRFVNIYQQILN